DACLWAIAACSFWGLMRFGESTVKSRSAFDPNKHLTRARAHFKTDALGAEYLRLDLPSAKTAKPGEVQHVFLVPQSSLCPLAAVRNLMTVMPALDDDPLFCWRDLKTGAIRPMTRSAALRSINERLATSSSGRAFGHSFRIGGASHYLAKGTPPDVVQMMGCWRSLAYQVYVRSF
ncbi:uncharacterized protein BXZ73DRAFT_5889, partial [Epithele typhae]|uniref:uncharacterized protein n=1 Tax=Epithele typhae TaxID=378194 RepID=UPI002007ED9B